MARLAKDTAGNTLTIMAASIIPLAGLVGGAVDMSRIYLTKTRLQQACDAGALMGRKVMGGGQWSANSNAANTAALQYFDSNFLNGAYGSNSRTRSYTESNGKVTGTASVVLPMAVMKIFGYATRTISVTCDAEMRIPNTDVMFVLDTTFSMYETIPGDTTTKIAGLKSAVKCFYEVIAKLNTGEDCPNGGNQTTGVGSQVQMRFGFMPYASNVNVGKLLPNTYFPNSWTYSTRKAHLTLQNISVATYNTGTYNTTGSPTITVTPPQTWSAWANDGAQYNNGGNNCGSGPANDYTWSGSYGSPYNQTGPTASGNNQVYTQQRDQNGVENDYQLVQSGSGQNKRCQPQKRTRPVKRTQNYTRTDTPATWNQDYRPNGNWSYGDYSLDISGLKNGTGWNSSVALPVGSISGWTVNNSTVTWDGCIEERATIPDPSGDDWSTMFTGNYDLNIDLAPISGNAATMWGPILNGAVFVRPDYQERVNSSTNYSNPTPGPLSEYSCPTEAKKLQTWDNATLFENYVNALTPASFTYHDIGLLWGARFISPTGIFASENATTPLGGAIERHLIFMTDGQACSKSNLNQAYGLARIRQNNPNFANKRVTNQDVSNTAFRCSTDGDGGGPLTQEIVERYVQICEAVKNKNITLWVIYYGNVAADDRDRMEDCATDNRFYEATSTPVLMTTLSTIAAQISQLRLTQ